MDFLYISPEFPPYGEKFIRRIVDRGARVWAIGETDFYFMPEGLRSLLKWYVRTDLKDTARVRAAVETLLSVQAVMGFGQKFDLVESHNEQWLRLEGFINETFRVPGIRPADLDRLKLKSEMKRLFRENGFRVAPGERVESVAHGIELARSLGFPLILKPDEGVGASGIYRIIDEDSLRERLRALSEPYVLEAFVEGPIVTYDGLTDRDGSVVFESSLVYANGVLDNVLGRDVFFYVNRQVPRPLARTGERLVSVFGIRRKFFHFEFFRTDDGYLPIEINCRPPGGVIVDMMNYSADVDLYEAYARVVFAEPVALTKQKRHYCCYLGRRDRDYVMSHEEMVAAFEEEMVAFGENPPIFQEAMGRYYYLLRSPSENEMWRMAQTAQRCVSG